jgi:hypothetical protein
VKGEEPPIGTIEPGKLADLVIVAENPLANLKVLYGTGAVRLDDETGEAARVGGVTWTIKDGIVYDAKQLLEDVAEMVRVSRRWSGGWRRTRRFRGTDRRHDRRGSRGPRGAVVVAPRSSARSRSPFWPWDARPRGRRRPGRRGSRALDARSARAAQPASRTRPAPPPSSGLDSLLLEEAYARAARDAPPVQSARGAPWDARGRGLFQWRLPRRIANIKSASKSVISTLVGIAIEEGRLEGLDQRVLDLLPEYRGVNEDPRIEQLTVGNLLSMQAGSSPPRRATTGDGSRAGTGCGTRCGAPSSRSPGDAWSTAPGTPISCQRS